MRQRPASGGRESRDFCGNHAVNQGIDIPRSPKKSINSNHVHHTSEVGSSSKSKTLQFLKQFAFLKIFHILHQLFKFIFNGLSFLQQFVEFGHIPDVLQNHLQ